MGEECRARDIRRWEAGVTLIEVIIACFILSFALYVSYSVLITSRQTIGRTGRRFEVMDLSRNQMETLRRIPYQHLPPEEVVVPATWTMYSTGGIASEVPLHQRRILPDSVRVTLDGWDISSKDYSVDAEMGVLYFRPEYMKKRLTVGYTFTLSQRLETARVPEKAPFKVRLLDKPKADSIRVNCGNEIIPLAEHRGRELFFKASDAGRVIQIAYEGVGVTTLVEGRFADPEPGFGSGKDFGVKEITLTEKWESSGVKKRIQLSCLRTK